MPKTVVVVPCYNEAHRFSGGPFLEFVAAHGWLSFLFVDDGSSDATREILTDTCRGNPDRLRVLGLPANAGKGEAVRQGVLEVLRTDAKLVGYWDADLATPLSEVPAMCRLLIRQDGFMVLGARVRLLGRSIERNTARHYLGRFFATFVSAALDLPVYDTQCGAKVFRCDEHARAIFSVPFATRWVFDVEILARLLSRDPRMRDRLVEHPLQRWTEVGGSKLARIEWVRAGIEVAAVSTLHRVRNATRRARANASPLPKDRSSQESTNEKPTRD